MMTTETAVSNQSKLETDGGKFSLECDFIEYLEQLAGIDFKQGAAKGKREINRAALARLRRTLGKNPNDATDAFRYVATWAECAVGRERMQRRSWEDQEWCEAAFYLVAALFASYQTGEPRASWHHAEELSDKRRNFGASFLALERAQLKDANINAGEASRERAKNIERRFTALLVSRRADLPMRLRHAVSLLKSGNIEIDWAQLLVDLQEWRDGATDVYRLDRHHTPQRRWAKAFWRVGALDDVMRDDDDEPLDANETDETLQTSTED